MSRSLDYFVFFILFISVNSFAQTDDCLICHSDEDLSYTRSGQNVSLFVNADNYMNSAHAALECGDCHEGYDAENIPHKEGKEIYKVDCGSCHEDLVEVSKTDIHHRLKDRVPNPPDCLKCHGYHEIKPPSMVKNKEKEYCYQCHESIVLANPYHSRSVPSSECFDCHEGEDINKELTQSVHTGWACADCHNYISHNLDDHPSELNYTQKADCYICHSDVANTHKESVHGISLSQGEEAAMCWDCHGSHNIVNVDDENSPVNSQNLPSTCGYCHDDPNFVEKYQMSIKKPGKMYSTSVHGKLILSGDEDAPDCRTCHGVHDIKNRIQPDSKISAYNVPETCGECHSEITEEYKQSIHWIRAARGVRESPVCNDCHSEHSIHAINTIDKNGEIKRIQEETCIKCHQDPILAERYGLKGNQPTFYQDSYHGLAVMRGDPDAAFCVDCHGVHKILPKSHPESMVSENNVQATCQSCHEDASEVFSKSYSHQTESLVAREIEDTVSYIYFWLIVVVIGGMVVHNLVIFIAEMKKKKEKLGKQITIPRFTQNEVYQHLLLLTSFITLAITGFALKYPTSWWADSLFTFGMTEAARQNIHRGAAIVMMVTGIYHILYLLFTERGREVLLNLVPKLEDLKAVSDNMMYYLRISKKKPDFDKYDYAEKAEYWALIWGTIVMGVTGLILWFPTLIGDWAPVWLIKVSEIIHFYEAILASLAIIVWHWFFVIFHPAEYPMSFTWMDGKMSLEHYRHHHEKHFRRIVLEWFEKKEGKREKLSHSTRLFTDTMKKNGLDPDNIINEELNNDFVLREWLDKELGGSEEEK
ncbi:MAG: cytochrome c3 family protein [Melioribacteraceae bacterium]|nr:cytochrome c3 family protein [Melioribacteraceae bacterium]MCF8356162.1 cytochrome c3 family protein [Melioribacteraceae bacterium]MCF8392328.1 cytochrome c3 family protein [Melioribacteraceae bacterium]MCF8417660.1 cytochrome c3 family protein [Melioribacteraceae bacterium]